jgi:hypothetical protein
MRSDLDPRRRIGFLHVGEQEQHQQRTSARGDVRPPIGEIVLLLPAPARAGKADIDVPAGIAGIVRMRKAHRESPEILSRTPAPAADELIKGSVQNRRVGGEPEGLVSVAAEPDHRSRPGRGIVAIAGQVAPQDGAALASEFLGKGLVDPNEAVLDELLDLRRAERAHLFAFMGHGNPLESLDQSPSSA